MAGRGRGRGRGMMGADGPHRNDQQAFTMPPPTDYPTPEFRAPKLEFTTELGYWIQLKGEFAEFLKESPLNVLELSSKKDIERYSDRLNALINTKVSYDKLYDWTKLPNELKPGATKKKRKSVVGGVGKKSKVDDIDKQLKELEQKESTMDSDDEDEEGEKKKKTGEDDDDEDEDNENNEQGEDDDDKDMDFGTDYMNPFFDNGEAYADEDDNLDDDPVY